MKQRREIEQRRLRGVTAHWGPQMREHLAMVPVFDGGYRVQGLVGLDANGHCTWYPGVPLVVEPRRMVFRSSLSDASPQWSDAPAELFQGRYFFDGWGAIQTLLPQVPGAPSIAGAVNLAGNRIRGRAIVDVVFESPLHRVRAFVLRARWGRTETVPIFRLPPLSQSLQVVDIPPLDIAALGAPPERPEGWLARVVRLLVEPLLTGEQHRR